MKGAKIVFIAFVLLVVAMLTAPIWGGCNVNYTICSTWCEIRHFNSSFKSTACKGGCGADKVACLAR